METTSCLKAVVGSASQYRKDPSDSNLVHLQRDLDVGDTSHKATGHVYLNHLTELSCIFVMLQVTTPCGISCLPDSTANTVTTYILGRSIIYIDVKCKELHQDTKFHCFYQ